MPGSTIERPVTPLRQRMLEDMAMRGLRSHTQHDYIRFVRSFAAFLGRSPDTAQAEDIRRSSYWVPGWWRARHATRPAMRVPSRALPRRRALCTNWKKPRYKG